MGPEKGEPAGWTVLALDPDGPASLRFKMFLSSRRPEGAGRGPERLGGSVPSSLRLPQAHLYGSTMASHPGWAPGAGAGGGEEGGWLRALHGLA